MMDSRACTPARPGVETAARRGERAAAEAACPRAQGPGRLPLASGAPAARFSPFRAFRAPAAHRQTAAPATVHVHPCPGRPLNSKDLSNFFFFLNHYKLLWNTRFCFYHAYHPGHFGAGLKMTPMIIFPALVAGLGRVGLGWVAPESVFRYLRAAAALCSALCCG